MKSKRAITLQKEYLESISTKEVKERRASENWRILTSRQSSHVKSKLNSLGLYIYFQALHNHAGKIVIVKNGVELIGEKTYKNFEAKLKNSDERWNQIIEQLYVQEFLKIKIEVLEEFELKIRKILLK